MQFLVTKTLVISSKLSPLFLHPNCDVSPAIDMGKGESSRLLYLLDLYADKFSCLAGDRRLGQSPFNEAFPKNPDPKRGS